MPLEESGGGLVRVRAYNRKSTQRIARVIDPALCDLFRFAQWSTDRHDGVLMPLDPGLPGRYPFSFFRAAVTLGKGVPGRASRTGLAATEYREKRIVRGHGVSLSLVPDGNLRCSLLPYAPTTN